MSDMVSRRRLLSRLLLGVSALAGAAASVPIIGYLIGPLINPEPEAWRDVGAVDDFTVGKTVGVTYEDPHSLAWSGETSEAKAWLRRNGTDSFTAFAENCTHLGCPVTWKPGAEIFLCPCHGGVFNAEGKVAGGPPRRPLWQHDVRVRKGRVEISTGDLPIA